MLIRKAFFVLLVTIALNCSAVEREEDHRAWQHGIDLIHVGEKLLLIWGSPGNPPKANVGGDWQHDIYFSWIDSRPETEKITVNPQLLVSNPEAQEPPSAAINSQGTIMVTSEDGNGGINQHAGLWSSDLGLIRKYPYTIRIGGHSGHVAAMNDQFLVTYGEGWIDGGGWRNLGTGETIYARVIDNKGKFGREAMLTDKTITSPRDSWPLVAGSDRNWLAVWQRYPELTLQSALIDASGKVLTRHQVMDGLPLRYSYDVEFAHEISRYVVAGTTGNEGFVSLLDLDGNIIKNRSGLPPMQAESRIIFHWNGEKIIAVYPVKPHGIAVLALSDETVELIQFIDDTYEWDYSGTTGTFLTDDQVLFATLSTQGLRLIKFTLGLK